MKEVKGVPMLRARAIFLRCRGGFFPLRLIQLKLKRPQNFKWIIIINLTALERFIYQKKYEFLLLVLEVIIVGILFLVIGYYPGPRY